MRIYTENKLNLLREYNMPDSWKQKFSMITNPNIVRQYNIDLSSDEAKDTVKSNLHRVKSMKRIQNPALWKRYQEEKRRLQEKYKGERINEILGYHGTKNTPPSVIINDAEGFDTARAKENCLYGKGLYFAKHADYSLKYYAYTEYDNTKTLFLANVLIGNAFDAKRWRDNSHLRQLEFK